MIHSIRVLGVLGIVCGVTASTATGCGKGDPSDGSGSEIASSAMAGAASSSEGTIASLQGGKERKPLLASVLDQLMSQANAASCSSVLTGVACAGTMTIPYASCTTGFGSGTWTGNQIITYSAGSCTGNATNIGASAANSVFTRTTDATGVTRTGALGLKTTLTTPDSSGYSVAKTGGAQITCGGSGCATSRTVKINGQHYVGSGGISWDHSVSTDTDISITGSGATRVINSGAIRVQHNLAKFTTISTINGPLTHSATCCFPLSGSVSTSFSGGKLDGKTETLAFSSTCGAATLTDSNGGSQAMTLSHCL